MKNPVAMILNKLKNFKKNVSFSYLKFLELDIDDRLFLLEGGQGTNINGNMFSLLKEIKTNPKYEGYKVAFVVTEKNLDSAKARMKFYGFDDVVLAVRNSKEYCKLLATAKYISTDNSFPPYFNKRDEQVYLNTWHGTPLKTLGKSDKSFAGSMANIQKNYLMSDYALFPNQFTKDVFMNDYDLKNVFKNESLIANYPRNYIFYNAEQGNNIKAELGFENMQVFAYMPTWRGTNREADAQKQISEVYELLKQFDEKLSDNQLLLVNLHFLLASSIDCSKFKHIKSFSKEYDTYEVLNACDGLVTDYSSVFFDFAVTKKKIVLLAYDKEDYLATRGIYIPFDELPFPIVKTVEETIEEFKKPVEDYSEFINEYCPNGSYNQCEDLIDMMINGKTDKFALERNSAEKEECLIYAGSLAPALYDGIRSYVDNDEYNYIISYNGNVNEKKLGFIQSFSDAENVTFLGLLTANQATISEMAEILLRRILKVKGYSKRLKRFFSEEKVRKFYHIEPAKAVKFSSSYIINGILSALGVEVENAASLIKRGSCKNIAPLYLPFKKKLKCISLFKYTTPTAVSMNDVYITIGDSDKHYAYKLLGNKSKKSRKHIGIYSFDVPLSDILNMASANEIVLNYQENDDVIKSNIFFFGRIFLGLKSRMLYDKSTDTVAIFRQSLDKYLTVYTRSRNVSDSLWKRFIQAVAFAVSILWRGQKADELVILFEKNSSKYEESASVVYEGLIDRGYKNAYFICDKSYEYLNSIDEKYRKNILYKNTFKHYLYFFKAKTFIGTEAMVHAIDLKTFNLFALMKVASRNINYTFLQHGVMYMVSLNSEARDLFKRKNLHNYRVVVSSEEEARHFTELGDHLKKDLYICGLPKYDKNTLNENADKIIIMPTWRPWEINQAREDFEATGYFKMVMKIYNSVPDNLKEKVVILPHPLIVNELKHIDSDIKNKVLIDARYDDILKQARLLITDYSSIAYDAFYRGSRVIFYWEEKDECMAQYGPSTKLMLNEENVYGKFFYNTDGLMEDIEYDYNNEQSEEYKKNYSKIVQFHDGKNTERLIQFLVDDKIIKL